MRVLGALLLAAPLIGFFTVMARIEGWRVAAAIWAGSIAATGVMVAGIFLLFGLSG